MEVAEAIDLEQILRNHPGDLASWRLYGDLLLAQGDARGALIQLELRRACAGPADREVLRREIVTLVTGHQADWDAALPPGVSAIAHRHGFATKVDVEWSDDAPTAIEQALRQPFVTALRIAPPPGEEEDDDYDDDGELIPPPSVDIGALAALDLGRLVELDLSYLRIGASGAALLASTVSGRIEVLDLRYCAIGDAGVAALAASMRFGDLGRLHLQSNGLTADGVRSLGLFERLVELDLRYNTIGEEGAAALLEAPFAGSLKRLLLYRVDVGDDGAKILASAHQLSPALRSYWRSV